MRSFKEYLQEKSKQLDEVSKPDSDDPEVKKHPELAHHFYRRKIGDHYHTKILLGTEGKNIK